MRKAESDITMRHDTRVGYNDEAEGFTHTSCPFMPRLAMCVPRTPPGGGTRLSISLKFWW